MALTIVNVAYPLAPVVPDAVGGAEHVVAALDRALVEAGHRSMVIACAGSRVAGTLVVSGRADGALDEARQRAAQASHKRAILDTLDRHAVDVVHLHGIDWPSYLPPPGVPVLVTLHLPPSWYPDEIWSLRRPDTFLQGVSAAQHRACRRTPMLLPPIANGVPLPAPAPRAKRRFVLALGRLCPEKGFHLALDAARLADLPMLLAGAVFGYDAHERYVRDDIVPRLDHARRFIGPVSGRRKHRLLAAARCVLVPSLAPETSSLVAMEALAAGTPVIGFANGALPEIVEDGRTGFIVRDVAEMAEAIGAAARLRSADCRAAAAARFSRRAMTDKYLARYAELAAPNVQRAMRGGA